MNKEERLLKLAMWLKRAELVTDRKEAAKIIKKAEKHKRKLAEQQD